MKSIMQEASSISKAIEQGWYTAGCPQEFTVRILEEPQKNLMGLITTRSAKIALFFDERKDKEREYKESTSAHTSPSHSKYVGSKTQKPSERAEHSHKKGIKKGEMILPSAQEASKNSHHKNNSLWDDSMSSLAHDWLKHMLNHMNNSFITFTVEPQNFYLRITLSKPILTEPEKEKHLLATLSTLLLETMKKQFKTSLRGHKIVLTHQ